MVPSPRSLAPAKTAPGFRFFRSRCSALSSLFLLAVSLTPLRSAQPADFLPPILPWHGASEALPVPSSDAWATPGEQTGLMDSPSYDITVAYLRRLAKASNLLRIEVIGRTPQGREMIAVRASKDPGFLKGKPRTRKPVLLVQGGIHSGEIDGKDAGMMLLRDIALRGKAGLLDGVNWVFVPVFNIDGHERSSEWNRPNQRGPIHQGWRTTAQNLNLNRDYMKADSPEMRAMLGLIQRCQPSLYLDLHVTDGIDYQYDITFGYNGYGGVEAWSPACARWMDAHLTPALTAALKAQGHHPGPLVFSRSDRDMSKGLLDAHSSPRYSTGYGDARHLPTVLVENHSLKPFRQRVLGTYVLLEASLRALASHGRDLDRAIAADGGSSANQRPVPSNYVVRDEPSRREDFDGVDFELTPSAASGASEVRWKGTPRVFSKLPVYQDRSTLKLTPPRAYWVPASKPEVIDRLKAHGVRFESIPSGRTLRVEMIRTLEPAPTPMPFEGHFMMRCKPVRETREEWFPPGSVRVPVDQPLGVLAVLMLEPEADDSLFSWGFFPEILQKTEYIEGYAAAPMGERMLQEDPTLKAQFESKVASDAAFKSDAGARLQWFYERSRFNDHRHLLYPVGIER